MSKLVTGLFEEDAPKASPLILDWLAIPSWAVAEVNAAQQGKQILAGKPGGVCGVVSCKVARLAAGTVKAAPLLVGRLAGLP